MYSINNINCWIINLKPFYNSIGNDIIKEFQLECVEKNIFGIGWYLDGFEGSLADNKEAFLGAYNNDSAYKAIKKAVDNIDKIKEGDLVIMRLRDAHYYIGQVSERAFHTNNIFSSEYFDTRLSWMCRVSQWLEFKTDENLPSEIIGRLSQRRQPTLSRVANDRQRLLIAAALNTISKGKIDGVSKINLTPDNFSRSLAYMELEDLVCSYIYNEIRNAYPDSNYILLPSSCKVSRPLYEFIFVCAGEKPVTCQVKSEDFIDIKKHIDDSYRKIYFFSGKGYINEEAKQDNMEIISREKLFEFLTDNAQYMYSKISKYYTFDETGIDL